MEKGQRTEDEYVVYVRTYIVGDKDKDDKETGTVQLKKEWAIHGETKIKKLKRKREIHIRLYVETVLEESTRW